MPFLKKYGFARKNPHKVYSRHDSAPEPLDRRGVIKIKCNPDLVWCGPPQDHDHYEHPPHTAFQAFRRRRASGNIQHITPCFDDATVERAVNISLERHADYISMYHILLYLVNVTTDALVHFLQGLHTNSKPKLLDQFQITDPTSANARLGYKSGICISLVVS